MSQGYERAGHRRRQWTDRDRYWQRRAKQRRQEQQPASGTLDVRKIISRDNLYKCFVKLKEEGGQAPGLSGLRYDELSPTEVGQQAQVISDSLLAETYQPYPARPVSIAKPSGGTRQLRLQEIWDRVVAEALHQALTPVFDEYFLDGSWGSRPGRDTWQMLAQLEWLMQTGGCWVLAIDDIRQAFDNVPLAPTVDRHRQLLLQTCNPESCNPALPHPNDAEPLLRLIAAVLQGTNTHRQIGIDQGSPYSPTALNVLLQFNHDIPVTGRNVPWLRYVDNLAYPCRSTTEGAEILNFVCEQLQAAGLELKGKDGIADLAVGATAQLLGFTLRRRNRRLVLGIPKDAWTNLEQKLTVAFEAPSPSMTARAIIEGWITGYGPAFETVGAIPKRILHIAARAGFRETFSPEAIELLCTKAWDAWQSKRRRIRKHSRQHM